MRISDWSSDVCSSDLVELVARADARGLFQSRAAARRGAGHRRGRAKPVRQKTRPNEPHRRRALRGAAPQPRRQCRRARPPRLPYRSEEHTSELQSLMRISYAVFCLKKKKNTIRKDTTTTHKA